jgi:hypothetical protein
VSDVNYSGSPAQLLKGRNRASIAGGSRRSTTIAVVAEPPGMEFSRATHIAPIKTVAIYAARSRRCRSSGTLARQYMWRLSIFSLVS